MLLAGVANADFITSQVTCGVGDGGSITASNFCSVAGSHGTSASASASASFTLPTSPGPLSVTANERGFAKGLYDNFPNAQYSASFTASNSMELTLDTPGSPRPGLFLITGSESDSVGYDSGFSESIFGYSNLGSQSVPNIPLRLLSITLGKPFNFAYTQSIECDEVFGLFCGTNTASAHYDLHLYEADGVTPVRITLATATPEPSSAALLFLSLGGLSMAGSYVRRHQVKSKWLASANPAAPSNAPGTMSLWKCIPGKIRAVAISGAHTSKGDSGSPACSISVRASK
jgi:hypothetical protein